MPTYRLDNLDGGVVSLPSGRWRWYTIRVNSLPEDECEFQTLIFANEDVPSDIMRTHVPPEIDVVDEQAVQEYGSAANERQFRLDRGRFKIFRTKGSGGQPMWRVQREGGQPYWSDIAIEKKLGDLSQEELAQLARGAL